MTVYVVYGMAFEEVICDGVFTSLEKALTYVFTNFAQYIIESITDNDITPEYGATEVNRMKEWLEETLLSEPDEIYFNYDYPKYKDVGILYRIDKFKVQ